MVTISHKNVYSKKLNYYIFDLLNCKINKIDLLKTVLTFPEMVNRIKEARRRFCVSHL